MKTTVNGTKGFFKAEQERLNWMGRTTKNYPRSNADVTINDVYPTKDDKKNGTKARISFTFRNGARRAISENDYVLLAVIKNRIFFKTGSMNDGFLISSASTNSGIVKDNGYMRVTEKECIEMLKPFIGSYDLKYDQFYELYYIEREVTKNEIDA